MLFTQLYYYACSVTTVLEHFIDAHMSFLNQQNSRMQSIKKVVFPFIQCGTAPSEAPDKTNNHPHIVLFQDEEDGDNLLGQLSNS